MVWVGAEYSFASTFSYRIPYFSSSYALSAPTPSPSTVKLAAVSSIINRSGDIEKGRKLFYDIKMVPVCLVLPNKIAIYKSFMKRLKQKRSERGFERTFGIREYIVYGGTLNIHLDVPQEKSQLMLEALRGIQYFCSSDSVCSCTNSGFIEPNLKRCPQPFDKSSLIKEGSKGIVFMLTDFTDKATFDDINPYSGKKMTKGALVLKPFLYPLRVAIKESNYTVYELI